MTSKAKNRVKGFHFSRLIVFSIHNFRQFQKHSFWCIRDENVISECNCFQEFPFADGSPMTELASFYQECLQAHSASEVWTDESVSTDSETLSQQLKMYEEAVPEFDSMVESMFSNTEYGSDHS